MGDLGLRRGLRSKWAGFLGRLRGGDCCGRGC